MVDDAKHQLLKKTQTLPNFSLMSTGTWKSAISGLCSSPIISSKMLQTSLSCIHGDIGRDAAGNKGVGDYYLWLLRNFAVGFVAATSRWHIFSTEKQTCHTQVKPTVAKRCGCSTKNQLLEAHPVL
jgi:hypothetical protein